MRRLILTSIVFVAACCAVSPAFGQAPGQKEAAPKESPVSPPKDASQPKKEAAQPKTTDNAGLEAESAKETLAEEGAAQEGAPEAGDEAAPDQATDGETAKEEAVDDGGDDAAQADSAEETPEPDGDVVAPSEERRKSASANQGAETAEDDYADASDSALVEKKEEKNLSLGIALDLTWPFGSAADYIDSASIQGLSLDLRYYAWGNIGVGVGVALNSLSKKSTSTVQWDNATVTGTQVRELSYTPITAKGYYAWRDAERFVPYVAAGVGAARAMRRIVVGRSALSEDSWHFALVPEAGLQIPVGPTVILTNVRLNYLPPSAGADEQLFANFSFGLSIQ